VEQSTDTLNGKLIATLFDFKIPPYTVGGITNRL
jgi:hypothetical protein